MHAYVALGDIEVLAAYVLQAEVRRWLSVRAWLQVVAHHDVLTLDGYGYMQRHLATHHIVLRRILDKELQCAGHNVVVVVGLVDIYLKEHTLGEALFEQVDIFKREVELLAHLDKWILVVAEHIAIHTCELVDEGTCALGLVLLNKVVEDAQRVKQEVGIYLLLEPFVLILTAMLKLALLA